MNNFSYSNKSFGNTINYLFILLLCCLIAYYPLTFHLFSLKNDALNYFLPVRHQISEAIYHGEMPFWSPYFNLGYPLHGDMQSGVWNPVVQLFSLFGPYTLKTLQNETLLYIYISGVGMFFLLDHFLNDRKIVFWASVAYMLSGFISDSAQFLNWISAASFLPFVFLFYHKTLKETSWKTSLYCGFFLYLFFASSYPADFIITFYVLFFYLIVHILQNKQSAKAFWFSLLRKHLLVIVCFGLLALPAIISFNEFLKLSERGSGAGFADAMSNPFHPLLIGSYITPLAVWKAPFVGMTDPLERNSYFGIITIIVLITSFFIETDNKLLRFSKWGFVITLIFSFGVYGVLRPLSYYILPLMNTFRHPANAKLFTIFFGCIAAAFTLANFSNISLRYKRISFFTVLGLMTIMLIGSLLFLRPSLNAFKIFSFNPAKIKAALDQSSFTDLILLNCIIQMPFMLIFYFFIAKKITLKYVVLSSVINSIIYVMLFQPFTVVKKDSVKNIQNTLHQIQVPGYPLPDLTKSLTQNSESGYSFFKEIGASNMYNKKIGRIDYRVTPSNLLTQNIFWLNEKIRSTLMLYPLIYRADTAIKENDLIVLDSLDNNKRIAIVNAGRESQINFYTKKSNPIIQVRKFYPNEFHFTISCSDPGFFCFFQNYYPRWDLLIDGKKNKIEKCNISFIGFMLNSGSHEVLFKYKKNDLLICFYINVAFTCFIFLMGVFQLIQAFAKSHTRKKLKSPV